MALGIIIFLAAHLRPKACFSGTSARCCFCEPGSSLAKTNAADRSVLLGTLRAKTTKKNAVFSRVSRPLSLLCYRTRTSTYTVEASAEKLLGRVVCNIDFFFWCHRWSCYHVDDGVCSSEFFSCCLSPSPLPPAPPPSPRPSRVVNGPWTCSIHGHPHPPLPPSALSGPSQNGDGLRGTYRRSSGGNSSVGGLGLMSELSPRSAKAMQHQTVAKQGFLWKQGHRLRTWKQRW